jgi:hypothetical protein
MLAYVVALRTGRKYTIHADEVRYSSDRYVELLASVTPATPANPTPAKHVVAVFDANEILAMISRDHLISEEAGDGVVAPISVGDAIPF